ncbi:2,3,4,5-tetrahydropyridine-2,6-dicarboxylate N-succinyltransferase [Emticicia sp. BO119]|uniref:2,3,4,5-tetrahydropyridine-2,6-dicarboxylate N-succinyltransferase n=1 Tax=Emticicia sp. BO119 TaxID=2757768 RepID=UPI0015F04622|nr:2,3,4,5-tetrahydropyridine-2,6-dicarboxylate N-succinyltransferase [Emticicia sp. BO119]MBA4853362.1 2,3,4,5-tetrahydropyridine-2,6-dicarboxylate N-succinyltransferase [Emticicia sp. BO119]
MSLKTTIEAAWEDRSLINDPTTKTAIEEIINQLNEGIIRVSNPNEDGTWTTNDWIKKAIILYFPLQQMSVQEVGIFEYHDKMKLKTGYDQIGVRVVPPAVARYGSYLAKGVILMPSYVNIGAYVDSGTMVDTWATVGSCAQIGKDVHLSGGVGIGGVLEPAQASPVIIEDGAFIGSRCIVVEGARIGKRAVLGAGVTITSSSKIIDVNGGQEYIGYVPDNSVVIPGMLNKKYPAGDFGVPCALIIGQRKASTDLKTSLNEALRENNVSV